MKGFFWEATLLLLQSFHQWSFFQNMHFSDFRTLYFAMGLCLAAAFKLGARILKQNVVFAKKSK